MKQKITVTLVALFLFSGCAGMRTGARYTDDVAKQWRNVDEGLRTAERYEELAKQARAARRFSEAERYSDEAPRAAQSVSAAAQESERVPRNTPLSDDARNLLRKIEEANIQAQLVSLRTQADDAVMEATIRMKTEHGVLADEDINTLHNFSKDLLCFHLETLANENRLPNDADYRDFGLNYTLARFVPLWEIKGKAESVIAFAQTVSTPRSTAEIQARARLLRECNL